MLRAHATSPFPVKTAYAGDERKQTAVEAAENVHRLARIKPRHTLDPE